MTRHITDTIGRPALTTALRAAWAVIRLGDRLNALGMRLEAAVGEAAHRMGIDEMVVVSPLIPVRDAT